jgi:CheY-like chemotaxis protein
VTAPMNILVLDDKAGILELVSGIGRSLGHRIIATGDPTEALDAIEHDDIDLLISDVRMPKTTGPEVVTSARSMHPGLAVLYMSASERRDGAPCLVKPFGRQDLLNAIHRALAANALSLPVITKPAPELSPWLEEAPPIEHPDEDLSILASR